MSDLKSILRADAPSLFPTMDETSKEARIASTLLAIMPHVPALSVAFMGLIGARTLGRRHQMTTWVRAQLAKSDTAPDFTADGVIHLANTSSTWSALVDTRAFAGDNDLYVRAAVENGYDAVIRLNNRFVAEQGDGKPVTVHSVSFAQLRLTIDMLLREGTVTAPEQLLFLKELLKLLEHPATAVEGFSQMGPDWKVVAAASADDLETSEGKAQLENAVEDWEELSRDLAMNLSRYIGSTAELKVDRRIARRKAHELVSQIGVQGLASAITVKANVLLKTITASMQVGAPQDTRSTSARIQWVLKMIEGNHPGMSLRITWSDGESTDHAHADLVSGQSVTGGTADLLPEAFEVSICENLGKRFGHRTGFVEAVTALIPEFYDAVAVSLIPWRALPPKPVRARISAPVAVIVPDTKPARAPKAKLKPALADSTDGPADADNDVKEPEAAAEPVVVVEPEVVVDETPAVVATDIVEEEDDGANIAADHVEEANPEDAAAEADIADETVPEEAVKDEPQAAPVDEVEPTPAEDALSIDEAAIDEVLADLDLAEPVEAAAEDSPLAEVSDPAMDGFGETPMDLEEGPAWQDPDFAEDGTPLIQQSDAGEDDSVSMDDLLAEIAES